MLVCEILNYDFWSVSRICQASVDTLFTPLPFIGCRTNAFGGGWEGGGGGNIMVLIPMDSGYAP